MKNRRNFLNQSVGSAWNSDTTRRLFLKRGGVAGAAAVLGTHALLETTAQGSSGGTGQEDYRETRKDCTFYHMKIFQDQNEGVKLYDDEEDAEDDLETAKTEFASRAYRQQESFDQEPAGQKDFKQFSNPVSENLYELVSQLKADVIAYEDKFAIELKVDIRWTYKKEG